MLNKENSKTRSGREAPEENTSLVQLVPSEDHGTSRATCEPVRQLPHQFRESTFRKRMKVRTE